MENNEVQFSEFGLNQEQTEVLFALQRRLIFHDVILEESKEKPIIGEKKDYQKREWFKKWDKSIGYFLLKSYGFDVSRAGKTEKEYQEEVERLSKFYSENLSTLSLNTLTLKEKIDKLDAPANNTVWKYMILLECVLYKPYYLLGTDDRSKKEYKALFEGLKADKKRKQEGLEEIAELLTIDKKYIKIFADAYDSSLKSLSGYWIKVLIAGGIGLIVSLFAILTFQYQILALFAANGLTGAALISGGLAALGGGAIAAGGFGMAGGLAVLVGGGALLGVSAGSAVGFSVASLGSPAVLSEAAKLQVVMKEIILAIQKDTACFQQILLNINQQIKDLKDENIKLKAATEINKEKIEDLEESIKILEKLVESLVGSK